MSWIVYRFTKRKLTQIKYLFVWKFNVHSTMHSMFKNKKEKSQNKKENMFIDRCLFSFSTLASVHRSYGPVNDKEILVQQNKLCNQFNNRTKWKWDCLCAVKVCFTFFLSFCLFVFVTVRQLIHGCCWLLSMYKTNIVSQWAMVDGGYL